MLFPESFNLHINLVICRKLHIRWNKWPSLPGILPLTVFSLDVSYRQAWKLNQLEVGECTESSHPLIKTALYPFSIYTNIFHLYMCLCLYRGVCMYKEWTPHIILIPRKKKKKRFSVLLFCALVISRTTKKPYQLSVRLSWLLYISASSKVWSKFLLYYFLYLHAFSVHSLYLIYLLYFHYLSSVLFTSSAFLCELLL